MASRMSDHENRAMPLDARVYVAGHRGLVGSAITRELRSVGYKNLISRGSSELDLRDRASVRALFEQTRPEYVIVAAAKVGGILANSSYPADFITDNLAISMNVIEESFAHGVKRLMFLGSSCIYPKLAPQPLKEEYLLTGPLEPTNRPYAVAKIAGIELCWAYNRQHGTSYIAAMPTNMYGPGDNYHPQNSHVLPALIRRMHEAKETGAESVTVWGTGKVRREFMYSEDCAAAIVYLMNLPDPIFNEIASNPDRAPIVNVGCGEDVTIADLASMVADVVGYRGRLQFDPSKPDGTPRKLLDVTRLRELGWARSRPLRDGLTQAYADFVQHYVSKQPVA